MGIPAAVVELNKEIAQLDKRKERLAKLRDALLKEEPNTAVSTDRPAPQKKAAAKKKSVAVKKTAAKKKPLPKKKRRLSPEGRKRIGDAARARWARVKDEASA